MLSFCCKYWSYNLHYHFQAKKTLCIAKNKELASKYRTIQNEHMVLKDKYTNNFEDRVKLENAIKDVNEVCLLLYLQCTKYNW